MTDKKNQILKKNGRQPFELTGTIEKSKSSANVHKGIVRKER